MKDSLSAIIGHLSVTAMDCSSNGTEVEDIRLLDYKHLCSVEYGVGVLMCHYLIWPLIDKVAS